VPAEAVRLRLGHGLRVSIEGVLVLALIVHWIAGSILVYRVAYLKGRNPAAWGWGAALVLTPLLAIVALAALPSQPIPPEAT
jgi:hypothetical protein